MGWSETIAEVAKFGQKLIGWLMRRRPSISLGLYHKKDLKALRRIARGFPDPRVRKSDGLVAIKGGTCWIYQVKFRILRYTNDANEMLEILKFMRTLVSQKALKRFSSNCPDLPEMLNSICYCCSGLDGNKASIRNLTPDIEREICSIAVEVSRVLLLPLAEKRSVLHDDTLKSLTATLSLYANILDRFSANWSADLSNQIRRTVEFIPSIIQAPDIAITNPTIRFSAEGVMDDTKNIDCLVVYKNGIGESLQSFCRCLPRALMVVAHEHRESWKSLLQSICGRLPPHNIRGSLCKVWRRLVISSKGDGFNFLKEVFESTFDFIKNEIELNGGHSTEDCDEVVFVVGCLYDFLRQCCMFKRELYAGEWHSRIGPIIAGNKSDRSARGRDSGPVHEYLEKMLECISSITIEHSKERNTQTEKESKTRRTDPADTIMES